MEIDLPLNTELNWYHFEDRSRMYPLVKDYETEHSD